MKKRPKQNEPGFPDFANGEQFDALSDAEKEAVFRYYDTHPKLTGLRPLGKTEQKILNAEQKAERKKLGRPVVGEGARMIAVSIETGLLRQVDQYAKLHGLKRAQLIALSLQKVIGTPPGDKARRRKSA